MWVHVCTLLRQEREEGGRKAESRNGGIKGRAINDKKFLRSHIPKCHWAEVSLVSVMWNIKAPGWRSGWLSPPFSMIMSQFWKMLLFAVETLMLDQPKLNEYLKPHSSHGCIVALCTYVMCCLWDVVVLGFKPLLFLLSDGFILKCNEMQNLVEREMKEKCLKTHIVTWVLVILYFHPWLNTARNTAGWVHILGYIPLSVTSTTFSL